MARREYREGSVHQAHAKDCARKGSCGCKWRGVLDAGYTERGTRRRITVTAPTEAAARRRLRDRKAERARAEGGSTASDATRKTVAAWAKTWLELREHAKRPKTHDQDRVAVNKYILPTIGRKRLLDVTPADCRAVSSRVRIHGGPVMATRVHRTLIKMLRDAVGEGYAVPGTVFAAAVPGAQKGKQKPTRDAMESAQAVAVLSHATDLSAGSRWFVGLYQGLRQGEALGLTWDAVDFAHHVIDISWQLQELPYRERFDRSSGFRVPDDFEARHLIGRFHLTRPKTSAGQRLVPMVDTVEAALRRWREIAPTNPYGLVWARPDGVPIDRKADTAQWRALQDAAGVRHPDGRHFVGHEMRNTTATVLAEAGVDEVIVTAILGHSSIATSRGYMRGRQGAMLAALRQVEDAFTQPAGPAEIG